MSQAFQNHKDPVQNASRHIPKDFPKSINITTTTGISKPGPIRGSAPIPSKSPRRSPQGLFSDQHMLNLHNTRKKISSELQRLSLEDRLKYLWETLNTDRGAFKSELTELNLQVQSLKQRVLSISQIESHTEMSSILINNPNIRSGAGSREPDRKMMAQAVVGVGEQHAPHPRVPQPRTARENGKVVKHAMDRVLERSLHGSRPNSGGRKKKSVLNNGMVLREAKRRSENQQYKCFKDFSQYLDKRKNLAEKQDTGKTARFQQAQQNNAASRFF